VAGALPAAKVGFQPLDAAGDDTGVVPVPLGGVGRLGAALPVVADGDLGAGGVFGAAQPAQEAGVPGADHRLAERDRGAAFPHVGKTVFPVLVVGVGQLGVPVDPPGRPVSPVRLDGGGRARCVVDVDLDRVAGVVQRCGEALDAGAVGVTVLAVR